MHAKETSINIFHYDTYKTKFTIIKTVFISLEQFLINILTYSNASTKSNINLTLDRESHTQLVDTQLGKRSSDQVSKPTYMQKTPNNTTYIGMYINNQSLWKMINKQFKTY